MARQLLTNTALCNAKPEAKDKQLNDGGGLYQLIKPNGVKCCRFDHMSKARNNFLTDATQ
ncbi:Arm DNA-binding domain-containing protein [Methylobacter sp. BlB1]|uniref:Arm DNA-binding domain-containing protein n=1 Tax=Methylobacter sp. BlB1 TaxID=2785914 RepID=UPI001893667B|nr:Arm DNA-binding domain-containing protein [Methylobacter sp. BlB1]MBF6651127.1 DUF4102 domain-containing protein [Methylobacter sp. BlB1]